MGEVAVQYKVMPDSELDIEFEDILASFDGLDESKGRIQSVEIKPLAFGLMYVELQVIIEDAEGQIDAFEAALQSIEGVGEIEVLGMGRLL